jgi:hypothetical protein
MSAAQSWPERCTPQYRGFVAFVEKNLKANLEPARAWWGRLSDFERAQWLTHSGLMFEGIERRQWDELAATTQAAMRENYEKARRQYFRLKTQIEGR